MNILNQSKTGNVKQQFAPEENRCFPWLSMSPTVLHAQPLAYVIGDSTRIIIQNEEVRSLARRLAIGFQNAANLSKTPAVVMDATPASGDVLLKLSIPDASSVPIPPYGKPELYRMDVRDTIIVCAETERAMARALTTLHKAVQVSTTLQPAVVIDAPVYAERSVLIDVGRKYYSPEWMKNLLREMAWNQLNTLQLHLTDNEGVRVFFPSLPGVESDNAWSPTELQDILDTAAAYGIDVIPEIETPGHMGWILRNRPEFQLQLSNGQGKVSKALDFSIPDARIFLKTIIQDTLDMFPRCRHFHLGADEYFLDPITLYNTPQLAHYARELSGKPDADSQDAVRYFVNDLATMVQEQGKIARIWNDGAVRKDPIIPLDKYNEIECWSIWGALRNEMNVQELIDAGYKVKNAHGDFYFIIRPNWDNLDHPLHSPYGIYDVWRANLFMDTAGGSLTEVPSDSPNMAGAGIQVWADDPNYSTPEEVWQQLIQWMLPLGQRTWDSPNAAPTYLTLSPIAHSVAHPPFEF